MTINQIKNLPVEEVRWSYFPKRLLQTAAGSMEIVGAILAIQRYPILSAIGCSAAALIHIEKEYCLEDNSRKKTSTTVAQEIEDRKKLISRLVYSILGITTLSYSERLFSFGLLFSAYLTKQATKLGLDYADKCIDSVVYPAEFQPRRV